MKIYKSYVAVWTILCWFKQINGFNIGYTTLVPVTSSTSSILLFAVKVMISNMTSSHSLMGNVYKTQEGIHCWMVDPS